MVQRETVHTKPSRWTDRKGRRAIGVFCDSSNCRGRRAEWRGQERSGELPSALHGGTVYVQRYWCSATTSVTYDWTWRPSVHSLAKCGSTSYKMRK